MTPAAEPTKIPCIYCGCQKPKRDFDNEHVFSRSLCGSGNNWTLVDLVCKTCNGRFSKFETQMLQQSVEALARAFQGPLGRDPDSDPDRRQPMKVNHLYVKNSNDPLIYEAGFSFPMIFYFRPQIVDVGDDTTASLVPRHADIAPFQQAISSFVRAPTISPPRPPGQKEYEIVPLEEKDGKWRPGKSVLSREPAPVFLRQPRHDTRFGPLTPRIAMNDDGKLFIRADDLDAAGRFLELILKNNFAGPRPNLPPGPGHQEFFFGIKLDLRQILKAVLKGGMNLVAYKGKINLARSAALMPAVDILLEDTPTDAIHGVCRMGADESDFPIPQEECHQLMLDEHKGALRFRMRLYNSDGYTATLGKITDELRSQVGQHLPTRVVVRYNTTGVTEVPSWPA